MAKLIDVGKAIHDMCQACSMAAPGIECKPKHCSLVDALRNVSTVDAVEVVRCKDCKHTRKKTGHEQFMYNENVCICTKEDIWGITKNEPVWDDGFCSCGERKIDG